MDTAMDDATMPANLQNIPFELVALITEWLDLHDLCSLALTSRHLHDTLLFSNNIAKMALEHHAPSALETREARAGSSTYARSLRRCLKRIMAITQAEPFQIALLAVADNFVYSSGMFCYSLSRYEIRIRDLHHSSTCEISLRSRELLDQALPHTVDMVKYSFWPIHYEEGLLSCIYQHRVGPFVTSFLVVVDPFKHAVITTRQFNVTGGPPVVRHTNDGQVLLVIREETTDPGSFEWRMYYCDLRVRRWEPRAVKLSSISGTTLDSTVCFDIIGDWFYAVCSDPGRHAPDTTDWTSTYQVARCPLPLLGHKQEVEIWRRRHEEGPINDTWTTIKLEEDPQTGTPMILEVRMEWLNGESPSIRTCYKTPVIFPDEGQSRDTAKTHDSPSYSSANAQPAHASSLPLTPRFPRPPDSVHRDGAESSFSIPSRYSSRTYQQIGNAFIDLVGNPLMRLRIISRRHPSQPNVTNVWPPEPSRTGTTATEVLDLLQPAGHGGAPRAVMDDRIVVYSIQGERKSRHGDRFPIMMISFDPASKFAGEHWPKGATVPYPDNLIETPYAATGLYKDFCIMPERCDSNRPWATLEQARYSLGNRLFAFNFSRSTPATPNV